jgi:serine/threonine-protein kinase
MKLAAGTRLGRYEILAEIGRGGMGVVYRARDPKIDRLVAIKTISLLGQEPEDVQEYRERFVLEARAAGRLSHPGIVTIFDVGEEPENRDPYIVMEFINGESLRKLVDAENKKIALRSALQLIQELAEALHYAHSQGVIHRDIKPSNILVTSDWHAKIADFGIAKLNLAQLTIPGQLLGSPAYMSPEQLSGEGVDARSDLFSLGVILYTMITGYRPFQGNSATTVCFKVVNRDPIPVTSFDADLPSELDEIITRAMAKNPAERFQSGAEMAEAIAAFCQNHTFSEKGKLSTAAPSVPPRPATGSFKTPGFSRSSKWPARRLSGRARSTLEERIYLGGAIALLCIASFVLYRGLASTLRRPLVTPQAAAPQPTAPDHKSTVNELPSASRATVSMPPSHAIASGKATKIKRANGDAGQKLPLESTQPASAETTAMQLEIQHPFAAAELTVWLDNRAIYSRLLRGEAARHALVFRQVRGHYSDSIQVPSGQHQIHVRVHTADDSYDQSKTISGSFTSQAQTTLHISCDKRGSILDVSLQ